MNTRHRIATILNLFMICAVFALGHPGTSAYAGLTESGTVAGTVAETGFGNFTLSHDGATSKFLTGRETSYEPGDYRAQSGDKVSVTYITKKARSGENALVASVVKLTAANPDRKELKSPTNGQVTEVGRIKIKITVAGEKSPTTFDWKKPELVPSDWQPAAGDHVTVHFTKVPSEMGNAFVYVIEKIEKK